MNPFARGCLRDLSAPTFWPCGHWAGYRDYSNCRGSIFTIVLLVVVFLVLIVVVALEREPWRSRRDAEQRDQCGKRRRGVGRRRPGRAAAVTRGDGERDEPEREHEHGGCELHDAGDVHEAGGRGGPGGRRERAARTLARRAPPSGDERDTQRCPRRCGHDAL